MTAPVPGSARRRWAFLLQPKWIAGHLLVLFVAVVFVLLGFWQLHRNDQKHEKDAAAKAKYAAPAPALGPPGSEPAPGARAEATGRYDAAGEALLRNRVHDGEGGYDLLTPLVLDDGTAVVVDRGWVPRNAVDGSTASVERSTAALDPPAGPVTVRGLVGESRPLQPEDSVDQQAGRTTLPRVDLQRMQQDTASPLRAVYINAQYQNPAPVDGRPALPTPPPSDDVNHLQYAFQWFAFALIPLVGWPIVLYRVSRRHPPPS
jgi:cytochrome oxidase assembly protein ShyY1